MQGSLLLAGWLGGRKGGSSPFISTASHTSFFSGLHLKCLWLSYMLLVNSPRKLSVGMSLEILPRGRYQKAGPEVAVSSFSHTIRAHIPKPDTCKERNTQTTCHELFSLPFHLPFLTSFLLLPSQAQGTERGICDSNSKSNSLLLLEVLSSKYLR